MVSIMHICGHTCGVQACGRAYRSHHVEMCVHLCRLAGEDGFDILKEPADILSPCGYGGVLSPETVPLIKVISMSHDGAW